MKDKQYYIELANRYFDAETSVAEERELRKFLTSTTDEDFNDVKVVMGFMAHTAKDEGRKAKDEGLKAKVKGLKVWAAAAAVVALIVFVPFVKGNNSDCLMIAEGETNTNHEEVMSEMDKEMAMLFSSEDDNSLESEMAVIFN